MKPFFTDQVKLGLVLCWLMIPIALFGQTELSRKQIEEDFTIFGNILRIAHPSLDEYTSREKWDTLFSHFEMHEVEHLKTTGDLFIAISGLADQVHDGHLTIYHPKMDTVPPMFPLLLKIVNGKLYTDTDDFGIPLGSEIQSINKVEGKKIIEAMGKYAPSDGYNLSKKNRQIESEFGILHFYEYGESENYEVTYSSSGSEVKTITLRGQSFESIGKRTINRSSHFSAYHHYDDQTAYFKERKSQKWPFVYFLDSVNTAVLTVNSFGLEPQEFKGKLVQLFKTIQKKKVDHLVIDIRENNGGYRANAISLYSFFAKGPFRQRRFERTVTTTLPERKYVIHTLSDYEDFFGTYAAHAQKEGDAWVLKSDHAQAEMIPYKKPFKGKVYTLIGGKTFSAGSTFALTAKNDPDISLFGEETGGGYHFFTGQFPVLYELPNSKIMVRISLVQIHQYVVDENVPKGSTVVPDVRVDLTVQDLIEGRDTQLDSVIKTIQRLD